MDAEFRAHFFQKYLPTGIGNSSRLTDCSTTTGTQVTNSWLDAGNPGSTNSWSLLPHPEYSPDRMTRKELRERTAAAVNSLSRRELLQQFGISRVSELTGLDNAWLPVYTCVRALSETVSIHAGKGLDGPSSRAGAILEGIEFEVAEHPYGGMADVARRLTFIQALMCPPPPPLDDRFPARASAWNQFTNPTLSNWSPTSRTGASC